jgi:hypothetical protein
MISAAAYSQCLIPWHLRTSFFTDVPRKGQSFTDIAPPDPLVEYCIYRIVFKNWEKEIIKRKLKEKIYIYLHH